MLDEPTSSLDLDEVAELFRVIRELKQRGVAILFVSHFLDQVYEICDRVTVLRNGKLVGEYLTKELLRIDLVEKMLGRSVQDLRTRPSIDEPLDAAPPFLSGRDMTVGTGITGADVDLAEGEVLGVAGLLGSGRTELARALTGIDRLDAGIIRITGQDAGLGGRAHARSRSGSSTRPRTAAPRGSSANSACARTSPSRCRPSAASSGASARPRQRELAASWIEALDIRPADLDKPAGTLSGGNQQKVLLARLLALSPRVLVLDEPTRGIDVGAKVEIQNLVGELADNGLSVVFISAELEEVLRVGAPGGDPPRRADRRDPPLRGAHRRLAHGDGRAAGRGRRRDRPPGGPRPPDPAGRRRDRRRSGSRRRWRGSTVSDDKGSRAANIFDVARLAGVSHQTVSRVLNDLPNVRPATRARVEQAIAQLRYSPSPRRAPWSPGARARSGSSLRASRTTARPRSRCTSTSPRASPATASRP